MLTIQMDILDDNVPPPTGNPFKLAVASWWGMGNHRYCVGTGLRPHLPKGMTLLVEAVPEDDSCTAAKAAVMPWILSHKIAEQELFVMVKGQLPIKGQVFAKATIISAIPEKVRFLQMAAEGGRIIRGDPASVQDSGETSDSES